MAIESAVGNDIALYVNTGTVAAPVFTMIGLQRDLSWEQTRELIDASHKGSDHAQSVYGRMESTISLDALEPNPDSGARATQQQLIDAQVEKTTLIVQHIQKNNGVGSDIVRQAEALVGSISREAPDNDTATVSVEITLQEALTVVVPPAGP